MSDYLKKSLATYTVQILRLLLVAGSNIVIARFLGPSGKGILTLLVDFSAIVVMLGMVGIDEANVYYISSKKATHGRVFSNALFQTLLLSIFCVAFFLIFKDWFLRNPLRGIPLRYFYMVLFIVPLYFFNQHAKAILLGHRAIYQYNAFIILQFFVLFVAQLFLIPCYNLFGGVLSIIISVFILTLMGVFLLLRYGSPIKSVDFALLKNSYSFGVRSQLGLVFSFLNRRLDIFIVNYFLSPYQVGIYAIAVAVGELPWHLPSAVATILFPWIAGMKREEATRFSAYILRNILFVTTIMVIILAFVGRFLIAILFGSAFDESTGLLYVLLPGILALGITRVLGGYFQGIGRPELGTLMVSFSFVETITLDLLLIPRMGAMGAAIASSISYVSSAIVGLVIFTRIGRVNLREVLVPKWNEIVRLPEFFRSLRRTRQ